MLYKTIGSIQLVLGIVGALFLLSSFWTFFTETIFYYDYDATGGVFLLLALLELVLLLTLIGRYLFLVGRGRREDTQLIFLSLLSSLAVIAIIIFSLFLALVACISSSDGQCIFVPMIFGVVGGSAATAISFFLFLFGVLKPWKALAISVLLIFPALGLLF
ncbi:MAG: hypothetical protein A3J04_02475 [Candidatus Ryanbacteria bacterium RIFCSPLOWO2_02_FULL_47_14]|uniref:Uncharacterized protein n=1 Tax=Candidatus Ryanbacteria bacterium RIFCSPLOWO2_02_FULL_47_14 TaxID=1802129 RepID=A0A1G2GXB1_9BACT|nr:MAG: hypothetical protein A3J04_02475 [Candidatus Ryanbacteria bacterium RIFCSPLOWO2_02_FULL_47_14]